MLGKYTVRKSLVAFAKGHTLTEIPPGTEVKVYAMHRTQGTVIVKYRNRWLTVLTLDFLDSLNLVEDPDYGWSRLRRSS